MTKHTEPPVELIGERDSKEIKQAKSTPQNKEKEYEKAYSAGGSQKKLENPKRAPRRRKDETDAANLKNADLANDIAMRKELADKVFKYLCYYSIGIFSIILFQGLTCIPFQISDTAFSILIGSTAVTVIGLVAIILRGLFYRSLCPACRKKQEKDK